MEPVLAVHGGAWNIPDGLWEDHRRGCEAAWQAGMAVLRRGGSTLDGIAAAISVMEDDPTFDAGYGSFLNEHGEVELDAGLMEGDKLANGAVVGVSRVKHPIELALHVLRQTPHCLLAGAGAHDLAERSGWPMVDPAVHIHPRERAAFERIRSGDKLLLDNAWRGGCSDTVGAVARDRDGNLAAGNSTGGTRNKLRGRPSSAWVSMPTIGAALWFAPAGARPSCPRPWL